MFSFKKSIQRDENNKQDCFEVEVKEMQNNKSEKIFEIW